MLTNQGFAPQNYAVQHNISYICTVFFMVLDLRLAMKIGHPWRMAIFFALIIKKTSTFAKDPSIKNHEIHT